MARPKLPLDQQRLAYHRQRAQAKFRGEPWDMTFDQWWEMWQPYWALRGMSRDSRCMIRRDHTRSWHPENCAIIERHQYLCLGEPWHRMGQRSQRVDKPRES